MSRERRDGEELKPHHDVIIVGTGLVEDILAAALTKVGKTVLHFEKHEYYGNDEWSSFDLRSFLDWVEAHKGPLPDNSWSGECPVMVTPDALRRQWPRDRWGGALLNRQEGNGVGEKGDEDAAGGGRAQETALPPIDLTVPERCEPMPVLPKSYSSVRVIGVHGVYATPSPQEGAAPQPAVITEAVESEGMSKEGPALSSASTQAQGGGGPGGSASKAVQSPSAATWSMSSLLEQSRSFNLDISPAVLLCEGGTVDALRSSGVANYMEFKAFEGLYVAGRSSATGTKDTLAVHKVPCSKADVFTSKLLGAKDKRQLMKLLQFVHDWGFRKSGEEEGRTPVTRNERELGQGRSLHRPQNKGVVSLDADAFADRPFADFLSHAKLDAHAQWVVTYALALCDEDQEQQANVVSTEQGLWQLYHHLNGLGRYGPTAFLWPVYGVADFVCSFCRIAAVWGGTYVCREAVTQVLLDPSGEKGRCLGVLDETDTALACDHLVLSQDFLPNCRRSGASVLKRIAILDGPVVGADNKERRVAGLLPPRTVCNNSHSIYLYQLDSDSAVVPKGLFLLYLVVRVEEGERRDVLDHALEALLNDRSQGQEAAVQVTELWGWTIESHILEPPDVFGSTGLQCPPNLHYVPRDRPEFYLRAPVEQAKAIFECICPGEVFLPSEVPAELAQYVPNQSAEDDDEHILESVSRQFLDLQAGEEEKVEGGEERKESI